MKLFKDISTEQFWIIMWSGIGTAFVILITTISHAGHREDLIIKELVEKGYDPLEISCLYNPSEQNQAACLILAQKDPEDRRKPDVTE